MNNHNARSYGNPIAPNAAGQRVATLYIGVALRSWMKTGTVLGFTVDAAPIILVDTPGRIGGPIETIDTEGCFRRIDDNGNWVRRVSPALSEEATGLAKV